ncbi:hypothetical protein [Haloechinothrix sp. LS1_15]|uniref:hypothetical protein n=1 Tax=Haloechinothrix sp. LS1_15 TaxID=2652248 RepID=UPI002947FCE5|nr:hypothetical protein [Haloechinothrix sp. LS1_15]MDV6012635.1 hypothetical protein [Haloechinothrix sp. LS1_15]
MTDPDDTGHESEREREAAGLPPSPDSGGVPAGGPPGPVRVAFWGWVVAVALFVVGFLLLPLRRDQIVDELVEAGGGQVTADEVAAGALPVLWLFAMAGIALALLMLLFAYKMREGTRSARSVLVALVLVMLAFHLALQAFVNPVTTVALALACAATVLLYLPGVGDYFPKLPRTVRRWREQP